MNLESHLRERRDDGSEAARAVRHRRSRLALVRRRARRRGRRCRRGRGRHPVLRPGDGRSHDPGGVASAPSISVPRRSRSSTSSRASTSPVPLVVMTYYNLIARLGHERVRATRLRTAGVDGAIVPDLPLDELERLGRRRRCGRGRDRPPRGSDDPRRPTARDLRPVSWLRLRRVAPRGHRRTGPAREPGRGDGPALQGGHRPAGAARRGDLHPRPGRRRRPRPPTA